jgi:MSHA biogenesis protein MshP
VSHNSRGRLATLSTQRGIGIPAALFVITLFSILAVAINLLQQQNSEIYAEQVSLTRAFYAAESGAGFAMNTIFPPEEFPQYNSTAECAAGPREYTFTIAGLNECTATVTCSVDATVASVEYYTIVSEGSCGGVTRTVQVRSSGQ